MHLSLYVGILNNSAVYLSKIFLLSGSEYGHIKCPLFFTKSNQKVCQSSDGKLEVFDNKFAVPTQNMKELEKLHTIQLELATFRPKLTEIDQK